MKPLVYIPQPSHPDALARLRAEAEVVLGYGGEAQLFEQIAERVTAVVVRRAPLTGADIARAPQLRIIARAGVGVDNIDVDTATRCGVPVCNVPDANTVAVAEHVFALLLAVGRNVIVGDRRLRSGDYEVRDALAGAELHSGRLGVIGFGRIGARVARIAREGFGMDVVAYDPFLTDDQVRERGAEPAPSLAALLSDVTAVSVHVPLTPQTRGLIGEAELAVLPRGAILVHTSRGGVVDEQALYRSLRSGHLAGAGVDVFDPEPPEPGHPFFELDNIVLAPHLAGQTRNSMRRMALGAAEAIIDVFQGKRPPHVQNPEVWSGASTSSEEENS